MKLEEETNPASGAIDKQEQTQKIAKLREKLIGDPNYSGILDDGAFLLRFLRARSFNLEASFQLITGYFDLKSTYPELFPPITTLKELFEANLLGATRSNAGETVMLIRVGAWDASRFTFDTFLAACVSVLEWMANQKATQQSGIVTLTDMSGFGWSQIRRMSPSSAKKCFLALEKCLPIRVQTMFTTNQSFLADIGYTILKPFMTGQLAESMILCGTNLEAIHERISPDSLPIEFGGSQGPLNSKKLYESLVAFEGEKKAKEEANLVK